MLDTVPVVVVTTGVCTHCGLCCQHLRVPGVTVYNYQEFLKKHPYLEVEDFGGTDKLMVPIFKCSRLAFKENGESFCTDHDNRPDFCRKYPAPGQKRFDKCTM